MTLKHKLPIPIHHTGYYAEHLSVGQEIRGNATVRVKNESRGFHLNNLSYVGPIVMGFGGELLMCVFYIENIKLVIDFMLVHIQTGRRAYAFYVVYRLTTLKSGCIDFLK